MSELKLILTEFQCRVRNEFTSRSLLAATVLFIDHTRAVYMDVHKFGYTPANSSAVTISRRK